MVHHLWYKAGPAPQLVWPLGGRVVYHCTVYSVATVDLEPHFGITREGGALAHPRRGAVDKVHTACTPANVERRALESFSSVVEVVEVRMGHC